jgi:hypothetical protein
MLPSVVDPALKTSRTTNPFASVVAKAVSPALSARTISAGGMKLGLLRGEEAIVDS